MSGEATEAWLRSGKYLPDFMRDFHDQKDLFKALDEVTQRSVNNGNIYLKDIPWTAAHVYTVDVFLWCLARRGYTLQRCKKRTTFDDIYAFIAEAKQRWSALAASVLGIAIKSKDPQP